MFTNESIMRKWVSPSLRPFILMFHTRCSQWLALLICIQELLVSKLGLKEWLTSLFPSFCSAAQNKSWDSRSALKQGMAVSFHILSNSLFINYLTTLYYQSTCKRVLNKQTIQQLKRWLTHVHVSFNSAVLKSDMCIIVLTVVMGRGCVCELAR
jgi:hypothetical protein